MNHAALSQEQLNAFREQVRQSLWHAVPAIVAGAVVLGVAIWVSRIRAGDLVLVYRQAAQRALVDEDAQAAELYFQKLISLDASDTPSKFGLALTAEQRGDYPRAMELVEQLAPLTEATGYAPAHLWIAQRLFQEAEKTKTVSKPQLESIEKHLTHVIDRQPSNAAARRMLGQLYISTRRYDEAADQLAQVVDAFPETRLSLAQVYVLLGKPSLAEFQGQAARDHFGRQSELKPEDVEAAVNLATAEIFLENYPRAVEVLTTSFARTKDQRLRAALLAALVRWFDRTNPSELARRLELLEQALLCDPRSELGLARLRSVAETKDADGKPANEVFAEMLVRGAAPVTVHFLLGSLAIQSGDAGQARLHLAQAYHSQPAMIAVANNLASLLAGGESAEPERALELMNLTIELVPAQIELRETRGRMLAKLGKDKEAVVDFESVLKAVPDRAETHAALADAYERLGRKELAAKHRALGSPKPSEKSEK